MAAIKKLRFLLLLTLIAALPKTVAGQLQYEMLAAAQKNGKWGYLDSIGKAALPFDYDGATSFSEGRAALKYGNYWLLINTKLAVVSKPLFTLIRPMSGGFSAVQFPDAEDGHTVNAYITRAGQINIVLEQGEQGFNFYDGLARVMASIEGSVLFGYMDTSQTFVVPLSYAQAFDFSNRRALVIVDHKAGFIDTRGYYIRQPEFDEAYDFSEGLAYTKRDGVVTFIDTTGKERFSVKPKKADNVAPYFREGLIAFTKGGKTGFMNATGKVVIKPRADIIVKDGKYPFFSEGTAAAANASGLYGYIDKKGKWVITPAYAYAGPMAFKRAIVSDGKSYGVVDNAGKVRVPLEYDLIMNYTKSY